MTMTLRDLRAWHEDKYNTKFLSREDYQVHFDAIALIDAHLSQPQPVAQGEAIGEVRENGVNWYGPNPHAFPMGTKFYTSAPAIPIGHRVVPEIMTAAMINAWSGGITVTSDAIALRTNFQKGWARVLAAASPSDGGV